MAPTRAAFSPSCYAMAGSFSYVKHFFVLGLDEDGRNDGAFLGSFVEGW